MVQSAMGVSGGLLKRCFSVASSEAANENVGSCVFSRENATCSGTCYRNPQLPQGMTCNQCFVYQNSTCTEKPEYKCAGVSVQVGTCKGATMNCSCEWPTEPVREPHELTGNC